jgi:hypothetical protein
LKSPPKADIRDSLYQLVGALLELKRNVESERFGGLEINYELVFCRLLEWQIAGFFAAQDAVDITRADSDQIEA